MSCLCMDCNTSTMASLPEWSGGKRNDQISSDKNNENPWSIEKIVVLYSYPIYIWGIGEAKRLFSASNLPQNRVKGEGKALGCIIFLFGTWIPRHISLAAERWAGREDDHLSEDSAGSKLAPQAASWNIQDSILWDFPLINIGDTFREYFMNWHFKNCIRIQE